MKTLFMICISAILLCNATAGYAAQNAEKEMQKPSGETCKRPPEPPKDKNGRPLPPPKESNSNHATKGQPPHDGEPLCPPSHDNKKP